MEKNQRNNKIPQQTDKSQSMRNELEKYLHHWKWFVLSAFSAFILAFFYLRYATPKYEVQTTLLIKQDDNMMSSELAAFQDLGMFGEGNSNIQNEMQLLKSRTLASSVVKDLNLTTRYFRQGRLKESEVFAEQIPIRLQEVIATNYSTKELDTTLYVQIHSATHFNLLDANKSKIYDSLEYNSSFAIKDRSYSIVQNEYFSENDFGKEIRIHLKPLESVVSDLVKEVQVIPVDEAMSTVLVLSAKHAVKKKGIAILDRLVDNYTYNAINDKSTVEQKTSEFISNRLQLIKAELFLVDKLAENYKIDNELTDIAEESKAFFETVNSSEQALFNATTQLKLVDYMVDYLQSQEKSFELIPVNLGFSDVSISVLTSEYNAVVLERNRLLRNSSPTNPMVINLDAQLKSFQQSLTESLRNLKASLQISLRELVKNDNRINDKIANLPTQEREYKNIARQLGIKESLYLYLLQKQEETEISLAVTTPNSKVIDRAYASKDPVSPKSKVVYLAALLLGLLFPFGILYVKDLLDTKLHSRQDMEHYVTAPILGDIPINDTDENIVVQEGGGRSSTAEAFRLLRTNLDFMLTETDNNCKTIFVTSTTSGEGKSFVATNLACTLSLSGKKVALLGMDLRKPKITDYLNVPNQRGVSNFIIDKDMQFQDLGFPMPGFKGMDVYISGVIPPNPAELLLHPKVEILFTQLQAKYDYIVVDTAPVSLVTDTLMIGKYADMTIYVSRAGYLDKRLLTVPEMLYNEKRLNNMAMLINASDHQRGYGYGVYGAYGGYGYGQEKQLPWWKKVFKS
ncbi:polysaccharide biosynthesis tyrosine autokinase [Flavicella sp.]|nr:polysaccharide biosynthesis tyrosine autokinase [Flavicella sp.]MDA9111627.1 polysaccharide biosynthesis tyrosine autokinase [Flavicella sp.]